MFLGVPESEVAQETISQRDEDDYKRYNIKFTHHQLLQSHEQPLGDGNNMFISISSPNDLESAPAGHRAVMISTHTDVNQWFNNPKITTLEEYRKAKEEIGSSLMNWARRLYPQLGKSAVVYRVGTPRTYAKFTR